MKKVPMKKSMKIAEKKAVRKSRLTKEEREVKKLKLKEEREAKKAARIAKREAKKQKEAERKAAAKAKKEERKAKKAARLQAEKERKMAKKLKAKERLEAKKAREIARAEKKAKHEAKSSEKVTKVESNSVENKIEAECNEWKALSAIRRYVKDNAKILAELDGVKLAKKIKKLQKMGYIINLENDIPTAIGYIFEIGVKSKANPIVMPKKDERKPRKSHSEKVAEEVEDQQPQDSINVEQPSKDPEEEKLLSDVEIIEAAESEGTKPVEILAGDTFKDETEIANDDGLNRDEDDLDEENDDEDDEDDDILGCVGISDEQAEYRREAFSEMEGNGNWD